jgi:hypothetical protein
MTANLMKEFCYVLVECSKCFHCDRHEAVCVADCLIYLHRLRDSASIATARSWSSESSVHRQLGAKVSGLRTRYIPHSHIKPRPCFHGTIVIPSGRLPSDLDCDYVISRDGFSVAPSDVFVSSLRALYVSRDVQLTYGNSVREYLANR